MPKRSLRSSTVVSVAAAVAPFVLGAAALSAVALTTRSPLLGGPRPAGAEVTHGDGFFASVDSFRGWFGSYRMGDMGTAWCVDHGSPAPDPSFGYVAADLQERALDTKRAMAWALGVHGREAGRIPAAALMLVLHDLMGAHYPSGPLSLHTLSPDRLDGFEGHEREVLERARHIRAQAVAHAHHEPPLALRLAVEGDVEQGLPILVVTVVDAGGRGVAGVPVRVSAPAVDLLAHGDSVTDGDGHTRVPLRAQPGEHLVEVSAVAPDLVLQSFRPTARVAQRVARPAVSALTGSVTFAVPHPARLSVHKTGDASPYLPVAGARFLIHRASDPTNTAEIVTDSAGAAGALQLPPGPYRVVEAVAPPGYTTAGPWDVVLAPGETRVLEVADRAVRGALVVRKIDAVTGAPVAGAEVAIRYDADRDGHYETLLPGLRTTTAPHRFGNLLPGDYEVEEVLPPSHYRVAAPERLSIAPGGESPVTLADTPLATATFVKVPAAGSVQDAPSLAGAVLSVRDEQGREVEGCVTAADGACTLPADALEAGSVYCVTEEAAPPGWAVAAPVCFTTGGAGSVTAVRIEEHRLAPLPTEHTEAPADGPATSVDAPVPTAPRATSAATPPTPRPAVVPAVAPETPARREELPRTGASPQRQAAAGAALLGLGSVLWATGAKPGRRARRRARTLRADAWRTEAWRHGVRPPRAASARGSDGSPTPGTGDDHRACGLR